MNESDYKIFFLDEIEFEKYYPYFIDQSIRGLLTKDQIDKIFTDVSTTYFPVAELGDYINDFKYNICVDCGSNIGTFSLLASTLYNRIVSFEADPAIYKYYIANMNHNIASPREGLCFPYENIESYNLALGRDNAEIVHIYDNQGGCIGSNSIFKTEKSQKNINKKCLTVNFKKMIEIIGTDEIDMLKVDIEGSEYDFLMDQDLSKIKSIVVELHGYTDNKEVDRWHKQRLIDFLGLQFGLVSHGDAPDVDLIWGINKDFTDAVQWQKYINQIYENAEKYERTLKEKELL